MGLGAVLGCGHVRARSVTRCHAAHRHETAPTDRVSLALSGLGSTAMAVWMRCARRTPATRSKVAPGKGGTRQMRAFVR